MKEISKTFEYKNKEYRLAFNLNVMEQIQEEYGTLEKWGELTDGTVSGEPSAKAVIFGFAAMLNEGIEIDNEEKGEETSDFIRERNCPGVMFVCFRKSLTSWTWRKNTN